MLPTRLPCRVSSKGRVAFLDIARIVEATLAKTPSNRLNTLEDVGDADLWARRHATAVADRFHAQHN